MSPLHPREVTGRRPSGGLHTAARPEHPRPSPPRVALTAQHDDVAVVAVLGPLYTANVLFTEERVLDVAHDVPGLRVLVLDLTVIQEMSVTIIETLIDLDRELAATGVELRIAGSAAQCRRGRRTDHLVPGPGRHRTRQRDRGGRLAVSVVTGAVGQGACRFTTGAQSATYARRAEPARSAEVRGTGSVGRDARYAPGEVSLRGLEGAAVLSSPEYGDSVYPVALGGAARTASTAADTLGYTVVASMSSPARPSTSRTWPMSSSPPRCRRRTRRGPRRPLGRPG